MADLRAKFNDKADPSYKFENQCVCYKRLCSCGYRFKAGEAVCPQCGKPRQRCQNKATFGEETCRIHASGRAYTLYNRLAASLSDSAIEELIERDDRSLEQEFTLAKVALSSYLDSSEENVSSKELMRLVKEFFIIAEKKKNIESGQTLNIAWDDKVVNALRTRMKILIKAFINIIDKYINDPDVKQQILIELKEQTTMFGNMLTVPDSPDDYK